MPGCARGAESPSEFCVAHGGGRRCSSEAHFSDPPYANYRDTNGRRFCWGCFVALHPELAKLKVRKEHHVIADVQRSLPWLPERAQQVVWDCPIPGGCSLKRPDMLYVFEDRYLQLEIDEDGHEDRSCAEEDTRLEVIAADVGLPGLVIRLNPDFNGCFGTKRLSNGERCAVVRHQEAYNTLISSAVAAIEEFFQEPRAEVRALGFPDAWWASRGS